VSRKANLWAFGIAAAAFTVLAVLVEIGRLKSVDEYAVRNLMPGGLPTDSRIPVIGHPLQYHGHHFDASQLVRLPANIVPATLVFLFICWLIWRRRDIPLLIVWAFIFGVGNAVVLIGKETIAAPTLTRIVGGEVEIVRDFFNSFPSGHTTRIVLFTGILIYLWPRLVWLLPLWAAAAIASLEIDHIHTPSDIAGGILLGTTLLLAAPLLLPFVEQIVARFLPRDRSSPEPPRGDPAGRDSASRDVYSAR
jgi:membrane-associated phospholipid phosphatase